ncbi:unnamed protein product [Vitrella brassicaformis CCMP3155]|uniref:non-specific serine/threonine protein kinase n=2 Tax=Vitrella brassicaformis TaxID=1169539 RepID=A0A0G4EAW8_VITBC|nr:unnamed protein product [Vitrella brassicaformis CCMP3155]|eukprot:CEL92443.1 unnamed protein product [Vitrella brassicaformis CCMP3155]
MSHNHNGGVTDYIEDIEDDLGDLPPSSSPGNMAVQAGGLGAYFPAAHGGLTPGYDVFPTIGDTSGQFGGFPGGQQLLINDDEADDDDDDDDGEEEEAYGSEVEDDDYSQSDSEGADGYKPGGYHVVQLGEVYQKRYFIEQKLGWGHFSTVWLASDHHGPNKPRFVALKFQKSATHYTEAAEDEIKLLKRVLEQEDKPPWVEYFDSLRAQIPDLDLPSVPQESLSYPSTSPSPSPTRPMRHLTDSPDSIAPRPERRPTGVVRFEGDFRHRGPNGVHVCMVFEVMGPNLLTLIKKYNFKGIPIRLVRKIATHVLLGLDYLHRECGIIHTDLKPENVLVSIPQLQLPVCRPRHAVPSPKAERTLTERLQATYEHDSGLTKNARKKQRKKIRKQIAKAEQGKDQQSLATIQEDEEHNDEDGEAGEAGGEGGGPPAAAAAVGSSTVPCEREDGDQDDDGDDDDDEEEGPGGGGGVESTPSKTGSAPPTAEDNTPQKAKKKKNKKKKKKKGGKHDTPQVAANPDAQPPSEPSAPAPAPAPADDQPAPVAAAAAAASAAASDKPQPAPKPASKPSKQQPQHQQPQQPSEASSSAKAPSRPGHGGAAVAAAAAAAAAASSGVAPSASSRDLVPPVGHPPFVEHQLKPSASDPSLLSSYMSSREAVIQKERRLYNYFSALGRRVRDKAFDRHEKEMVDSYRPATSGTGQGGGQGEEIPEEFLNVGVDEYGHPLVGQQGLHVGGPRVSSYLRSGRFEVAPGLTEEEWHQRLASLIKPSSAEIFERHDAEYKIVDLGNACWINQHFSEDIQTRQYRSPEVILGIGYGPSADIWSLACMIFELCTGDYLFDPKCNEPHPVDAQDKEILRDEDHLALCEELLGHFPDKLCQGNKAHRYLQREGRDGTGRIRLRHISELSYWNLPSILRRKYNFSSEGADALSSFLLPMLSLDPDDRWDARRLLTHPWLTGDDAAAKAAYPVPHPAEPSPTWHPDGLLPAESVDSQGPLGASSSHFGGMAAFGGGLGTTFADMTEAMGLHPASPFATIYPGDFQRLAGQPGPSHGLGMSYRGGRDVEPSPPMHEAHEDTLSADDAAPFTRGRRPVAVAATQRADREQPPARIPGQPRGGVGVGDGGGLFDDGDGVDWVIGSYAGGRQYGAAVAAYGGGDEGEGEEEDGDADDEQDESDDADGEEGRGDEEEEEEWEDDSDQSDEHEHTATEGSGAFQSPSSLQPSPLPPTMERADSRKAEYADDEADRRSKRIHTHAHAPSPPSSSAAEGPDILAGSSFGAGLRQVKHSGSFEIGVDLRDPAGMWGGFSGGGGGGGHRRVYRRSQPGGQQGEGTNGTLLGGVANGVPDPSASSSAAQAPSHPHPRVNGDSSFAAPANPSNSSAAAEASAAAAAAHADVNAPSSPPRMSHPIFDSLLVNNYIDSKGGVPHPRIEELPSGDEEEGGEQPSGGGHGGLHGGGGGEESSDGDIINLTAGGSASGSSPSPERPGQRQQRASAGAAAVPVVEEVD